MVEVLGSWGLIRNAELTESRIDSWCSCRRTVPDGSVLKDTTVPDRLVAPKSRPR